MIMNALIINKNSTDCKTCGFIIAKNHILNIISKAKNKLK